MIDMKEFISDLWLDKWIDTPVVKFLEEQATIEPWMPTVRRETTMESPTIDGGVAVKVIELVDVSPTVIRVPARFHKGIVLLNPGKTLLRKVSWLPEGEEVLLHQSMFEDPHNVTDDEIELLRMTHPELFRFAAIFHRNVRSAMIEATQILTKEGKI